MKIYITRWWKSQGIVCAAARQYKQYWTTDSEPHFFGKEGSDCELSAPKAQAAVRQEAEKRLSSLQKRAAGLEQLLADPSWPPVPES